MFAGHSGRGDRTCARMAASRRGVAARETGDPGRVAGRERHVFRCFVSIRTAQKSH